MTLNFREFHKTCKNEMIPGKLIAEHDIEFAVLFQPFSGAGDRVPGACQKSQPSERQERS